MNIKNNIHLSLGFLSTSLDVWNFSPYFKPLKTFFCVDPCAKQWGRHWTCQKFESNCAFYNKHSRCSLTKQNRTLQGCTEALKIGSHLIWNLIMFFLQVLCSAQQSKLYCFDCRFNEETFPSGQDWSCRKVSCVPGEPQNSRSSDSGSRDLRLISCFCP